jgi:hypothetical protein
MTSSERDLRVLLLEQKFLQKKFEAEQRELKKKRGSKM